MWTENLIKIIDSIHLHNHKRESCHKDFNPKIVKEKPRKETKKRTAPETENQPTKAPDTDIALRFVAPAGVPENRTPTEVEARVPLEVFNTEDRE